LNALLDGFLTELGTSQVFPNVSQPDFVGVALLPRWVLFAHKATTWFKVLNGNKLIQNCDDSPLFTFITLSIEHSENIAWHKFVILHIKLVNIWFIS